jgi:zinc protease
MGSLDSVPRITSEKIGTHFRRWVAGAPLVVAVCGEFSPGAIVPHFERMKREVAKAATGSFPFEPLKGPRLSEIKKNREQSHLIMGFRGTRVVDRERYDLRTLLTILGGQSGRLFLELRDKGGLCYTVSPLSFEGIEPGYIGVYMGCDPAKRDEALVGIRRELDRMIEKPVSASELKRAKEFVLGRHQLDLQLNSAVSGSAAFNTLYGLRHDEHLRIAEGLRPVTAASIQKLASRIFASPSVTALVV